MDLLSFPTKNPIFQQYIFNRIPQVQIHKILQSPSTIIYIYTYFQNWEVLFDNLLWDLQNLF